MEQRTETLDAQTALAVLKPTPDNYFDVASLESLYKAERDKPGSKSRTEADPQGNKVRTVIDKLGITKSMHLRNGFMISQSAATFDNGRLFSKIDSIYDPISGKLQHQDRYVYASGKKKSEQHSQYMGSKLISSRQYEWNSEGEVTLLRTVRTSDETGIITTTTNRLGRIEIRHDSSSGWDLEDASGRVTMRNEQGGFHTVISETKGPDGKFLNPQNRPYGKVVQIFDNRKVLRAKRIETPEKSVETRNNADGKLIYSENIDA
jgi:hypothetical protein